MLIFFGSLDHFLWLFFVFFVFSSFLALLYLNFFIMFKSIVSKGLGPRITSVRFNSNFSDLLKGINKTGKENLDFDVDQVTSFSLNRNDTFTSDSPPPPNPRDIAKTIKMHGPAAGRSVDVQSKNLGRALNGVKGLLLSSKVKYLKGVQSRYIRPAKYTKQKHREWWRRKFAAGFKDLMWQVNDARRRGY